MKALEPAAEVVVRSDSNNLVIAGPGAGKTELLAQRACYLLQAERCPRPKRILAISFKRDAARNLQDRVVERCGRDLAGRFESMTFDAFAKGLVDRFRGAIPATWRPTADYELTFSLREDTTGNWLEQIPARFGPPSAAELAQLNPARLYRDVFVGRQLPVDSEELVGSPQRIAFSLWQYLLRGNARSTLSFPMIGRLAELVLRSNPLILRALRVSYAFVFLDEFQDTTSIQYQLTETAFLGSTAVLTAVGDNKQRIMGWAGALETVFADFETRFGASIVRLQNNYRSAPELVRILSYLTTALDDQAAIPIAIDDGHDGNGECRIWLFRDHLAEADHIAQVVEHSIKKQGLRPRDICILTRNRPGDYTQALRGAILARGIEARVESELQDLLSEPFVSAALQILHLAANPQAPEARSAILDLLIDFEGEDQEAVGRDVERRLNRFVSTLRSKLSESQKDPASVETRLSEILKFFGRDRLAAAYSQYAQGAFLDDTLRQLAKSLMSYLAASPWSAALKGLEGEASIPIMTMHKSKGLEYHTVIFVGLEDSALWTFASRESEETCGFFVAFSRARKRVFFTFCDSRPKKPDGPAIPQQRKSIGRLYELLKAAGINPESIS
ncbi:MAG: ATP-dependent helicase [Planctomycetaceae bacterium]|nr:ATP-dependent helicase [Planctomycetaceae bacterium]MBN8626280.1 ATP-dependent helicase [Planctomycetota bacterium]